MSKKLSLDSAQQRLNEVFPHSGLMLVEFKGLKLDGRLRYGDEDLKFGDFSNLLHQDSVEELLDTLRLNSTPNSDMVLSESIGERLTYERVRLQQTRQQLADLIMVSLSDIRSFERGELAIPSDSLSLLFSLGYDIQFILTNLHGSTTEKYSKQVVYGNFNIQIGDGATVGNINC